MTEEDNKIVLACLKKEKRKDKLREAIQKDKRFISPAHIFGAGGIVFLGYLYKAILHQAFTSSKKEPAIARLGWRDDVALDGWSRHVFSFLFGGVIIGYFVYEAYWRASASLLFWEENPWIPLLYCGWLTTIVAISVSLVRYVVVSY